MLKEIFLEMLGSFCLAFFGGLARIEHKENLFTLSIAYFFIVGGLSGASKHISGCQFNPILTLSLLITKQINWITSILYVLFQLLGSFLGALVIYLIYTNVKYDENITYFGRAKMHKDQKMISATLEMFSMYILVFVYNSLFSSKTAPKHITAVSIASVYAFSVGAFGFHSGACISFVNVFGHSFFSDNYEDWSYYLIGQFIGALVSSITYWIVILKKRDAFINDEEKDKID